MNNKEKPLSEFTRRHETARRLERHAGSETCNGVGASCGTQKAAVRST